MHHQRVIIVHPELGVFVDRIEDQAVFSRGDTLKMTTVSVFPNNAEAVKLCAMIKNVPLNTFAFLTLPHPFEDSDALCLQAAGVPVELIGGLIEAECMALKRLRRRGLKLN